MSVIHKLSLIQVCSGDLFYLNIFLSESRDFGIGLFFVFFYVV